MAPPDPVDRLVARGVFETAGNDELRPAASFRDAVAGHRATLTGLDHDGVRETVAASIDDAGTAAALCEAAAFDPGVLARYVAVAERVGDLSPGETLALAVVVGHVVDGRPPDDGAPEAFLPVVGSEVVGLARFYRRCVVYAWREDCPPCETTRESFDDLFDDGPPDDVMLLAVYGPDCPRLLREEFDVVGAPTTLFLLEGTVDARLVGAPAREAIDREVEVLRDRTLPSA